MALAQHAASSKSSHLQSLAARHSAIEAQLHELSHHPSVSDFEIRKLKRQKLRVKEEMESL